MPPEALRRYNPFIDFIRNQPFFFFLMKIPRRIWSKAAVFVLEEVKHTKKLLANLSNHHEEHHQHQPQSRPKHLRGIRDGLGPGLTVTLHLKTVVRTHRRQKTRQSRLKLGSHRTSDSVSLRSDYQMLLIDGLGWIWHSTTLAQCAPVFIKIFLIVLLMLVDLSKFQTS